jgi:3-oxoacyl-ACP reductase-like protein
MSILSTIFEKLFPSSHAANAPAPSAPAASAAPASAGTAPAASTQAPSASQATTELDVEQLLDGMAAKSSEKLNWKTSIVDLLKLLRLDSSLASRKDLAKELHYTGDTNDSASMNIWLHRQVMNKVAANGGKVPADLKD